MIEIAKETKNTNRLFRINHCVYLFKGKFYKSDVMNIAYVQAKVKPSIKVVPEVCRFVEYTNEQQLKDIFNVR